MHLIQALILENHAKMIGLQRNYMLQPFFLSNNISSFCLLHGKSEISTIYVIYLLSEREEKLIKKPVIENYIEIDGKIILINELLQKRREEIVNTLHNRIMESVGYQKVIK